jgi:hypothetical protein
MTNNSNNSDLWKLDVNINKTKVMVFSKKKNLNYSFILQDKQLEVVETFSYLGIIFKYNPQTSEPYKSIGSIIESNNFNCKSTGMLSFLIVL